MCVPLLVVFFDEFDDAFCIETPRCGAAHVPQHSKDIL